MLRYLVTVLICISRIIRTRHRVVGYVSAVEENADGNTTLRLYSRSSVAKEKGRRQYSAFVLMDACCREEH